MNRFITRFKLKLLINLLDWYFERSCDSYVTSGTCKLRCRFINEDGCKITSLMKNIANDYEDLENG